jgi:CRP/FNR family transcriptional regulator
MIRRNGLRERLLQRFPQLAEASGALCEALLRDGVVQRAPAGFEVCGEGQACTALPMLLEGVVRVAKEAASGRELTLYRIHAGDSCVLTASCILSERPFPARAVVEEPAEALFVPAERVLDWLDVHSHWRRLLFGLVARRLSRVIALVEEVAFRRLDERLACLLVELHATRGAELDVTHQRLAAELGTSREVVTRVLRDFERQGWLETGRARIRILAPEPLAAVCRGRRVT